VLHYNPPLQTENLTWTRLKLGVYRSLGIDADQDHNTGDFSRAVIRNTAKGSVNVVNLDPNFDRFFYANHFWNSM
jgi:kinetochore protein Spc24